MNSRPSLLMCHPPKQVSIYSTVQYTVNMDRKSLFTVQYTVYTWIENLCLQCSNTVNMDRKSLFTVQ